LPLTVTVSSTGSAFSSQFPLTREEGQRQLAGVIMQEDAVGLAGARRWRLVPVDPACNGDDDALRRACDARLVAPVDQRMRRVKDEVDHPAIVDAFAAQQPRIKFARFRADAGKRVERSKKRIKKGRAHDWQTETRIRSLARLTIIFSAFIEP
jgi:hypothetical protein